MSAGSLGSGRRVDLGQGDAVGHDLDASVAAAPSRGAVKSETATTSSPSRRHADSTAIATRATSRTIRQVGAPVLTPELVPGRGQPRAASAATRRQVLASGRYGVAEQSMTSHRPRSSVGSARALKAAASRTVRLPSVPYSAGGLPTPCRVKPFSDSSWRSVPPRPADHVHVVPLAEPASELVIPPLGAALDVGKEGVVDEGDPQAAVTHGDWIVTSRNAPKPSSAPTIIRVCASAASCRPSTWTAFVVQAPKRVSSTHEPGEEQQRGDCQDDLELEPAPIEPRPMVLAPRGRARRQRAWR